jgi:hypothetical protein
MKRSTECLENTEGETEQGIGGVLREENPSIAVYEYNRLIMWIEISEGDTAKGPGGLRSA